MSNENKTVNFLMQKNTILWVDPIETEADIDWDCPCLEGVPCKPEVKAWYICDKERRTKRDRSIDCSSLLADMSKCSRSIPEMKKQTPQQH